MSKKNKKSMEKRTNKYKAVLKDYPILYSDLNVIECPEGWINLISDLSARLETINLIYGKKYRLEIRAEQVKEKFGTLRFYYGIRLKDYRICRILATPFLSLLNKLYDRDCENGVDFEERPEGFWRRVLDKIAYGILEFGFHGFSWSRERGTIMTTMYQMADDLIAEAEKNSANICSKCGVQIGTASDEKMNSTGWIRFYCGKCFKEKYGNNG